MPKNKYLDALLKLVFLSAVLHILILLISFAATGEITVLNYFSILDLDIFFPTIIQGTANNILSFFVLIGTYLVIFLFFTRSRK